MAPKVFISADTLTFNEKELQNLAAEGYDVAYVKDFKQLEDTNDKYCIIAFGTAATFALEFATTSVKWLAGLVAFYPTGIPTRPFCPNVNVLLHLPDSRPLGPPDGDDKKANMKYRLYLNAKPGFAEVESVHYDRVQASLAYSRTLAVLRREVGPEVDLEGIWENHMMQEFVAKDAGATMRTMVEEPYVNHVPTLIGGIGYHDLHRFYRDFFIPRNPTSLSFRLISRTIGTDRIVDEMIVSFTHDAEIPWMLPGVEPTGKEVKVALVSIVCVRGGLLYHEHIYWDQATVLAQIGLIDPQTLPVVGKEGAMKVEDKNSVLSNLHLKEW